MAKLKAPLLSLGASGAIGKAIVFFPWKGLNVAREYVVPANPKTDAQNTQRGYLIVVVAQIHKIQALAADALTSVDTSAYALWGSIYPTPRTWFNQAVKNWLDQNVLGKTGIIWSNGHTTPADGQLTMSIVATDSTPDSAKFYYGTSKTALTNSIAGVKAGGVYSKVVTGLTNGVKYYWQIRPVTPAIRIGSFSGIYYGTPKA